MLVLQAGGLRENGVVYILEMGEPVHILDLAEDLIRLSGLKPRIDIPIEFTGIRKGEKLHEELFTSEEHTRVTRYDKIHIAVQKGLPDEFEDKLE
ncbi:MAG: polysaccharide biosynthesis protein [Balneolaceae bacterium]|nr:polysaccharide biosynthesis protein [Balneolaceae bacterium]